MALATLLVVGLFNSQPALLLVACGALAVVHVYCTFKPK
jgi:hypothetical protein